MIASAAALLLTFAGILHSYSFMCRKLPAGRTKGYYPSSLYLQIALNGCWILMALAGFLLTYSISPALCALALGIYFLVLPFLLQPALARLLGFHNLTEYVETVDRNGPIGR